MRVALRRAAHQRVDAAPLVFADPFAIAILGPEGREELRRTPDAARRPHSAAMRSWVVARARYAEDSLAEAARRHAALQYLLLGAGLDTFALRNPYAHVRVFEVDHPATQAWKRERLQTAGLHPRPGSTLLPVNFETQSLAVELRAGGFQWTVPTLVAWLGVVPYLSAAAFEQTCRSLGTLAPGSGLIFDYGQPREVLTPVEQLMHDSLAARVAQAGEPFQLFFTPADLAATLCRYGFNVAEDLGSADLNSRYFARRTDGLQLRGSAGRLCHAVLPQSCAR